MSATRTPTPAEFGKTMRRERKRRDLTMGDAARRAGLSVVEVSDIELGMCRDPEAARQLVRAVFQDGAEALVDALGDVATKSFERSGPYVEEARVGMHTSNEGQEG